MLSKYSISGINIVTPDKILHNSSISMANRRIAQINKATAVDLKLSSPHFLYPAPINIHDHLRGNYLPRIGPQEGQFYLICHNWEKELRASDTIVERSKISEEECFFLGAYKNLFSGVVTVNDHFPHEINEKYIDKLPIKVIRNYALAHEATSYSLDWGDGIEIEHKRAVTKDYPFIIHMEEGLDEEYQRGLEVLEELDCLDKHDVLIHCIGFSEEDIRKVNKAGATVVWCPGSNMFMYNVTCKIRKLLEAGINVAIGTDSAHTGCINLLEEIKYARKLYKKMYGEVLDAKTIFKMITINPAKAFRMEKEIGSLEEGKLADLLILKPRCEDPYEALLKAEMEDIELVIMEGRPLLGSSQYKDFFKIRNDEYSFIKLKGTEKFCVGDPAGLLKRVREKVGYEKVLDFLPLEIN
jgi:hypothetical protein